MLDTSRQRTRNVVIRLSEKEREMLDVVAKREQLSISETVRWLVRREHERVGTPNTKKGGASPSKRQS